jgi:hypothetical protein
LAGRAGLVTARARMLPTFLIIGAQKCGTTSLHHYLVQHPEIGAPRKKEVHYFDLASRRRLTWYRSFFPVMGRYPHALESTPYYLFHPAVPARVRATLPEAKLIVLLRDPMQRTYSHYNHARAHGQEPLGLLAAIEAEPGRLEGVHDRLLANPESQSLHHQKHSYVGRSLYAPQICRWLEQFPREQLLVLSSEELFTSPRATVMRVQQWLGISSQVPESFAAMNSRNYDVIDTQIARRLQPRFDEDRAELEALTGVTFDWS